MLFLDKKLIVYNVYNYLFPENNPLKRKHKVNTLKGINYHSTLRKVIFARNLYLARRYFDE